MTQKALHEDMSITLGKDAPSYSTMKRWAAEYKHGRESLEDDPCPGRPVMLATPEIIQRIHDMVMTNR